MNEDANADLGGTLDETFVFNVEHVLPLRPSEHWNVDERVAQQLRKRLGNMVLFNPDENVKLGNKGFSEKRKVYEKSPALLTQEVAKYPDWQPDCIDDWQMKLAEMAVKLWPER